MREFLLRIATEYCERTESSFLSEPINFFSNAAFLISAYFAYQLLKKYKIKERSYYILVLLLTLIGVGSALWHSFRDPYALLLDALPIFAFFLLFLYLLFRKLIGNGKKAFVLLIIFFLFQVVVSYLLPNFLNGSVRHLVNGVVFGMLAFILYRENKPIRKDMIIALSLYSLAIVFRSVDNSICSLLPIGTHFLWHIFNAIAAFYAMKLLVNVKPLSK